MSAIFLGLIPTLYLRCLCTTWDLLFTRIYPQHMAPRGYLGINPRIKPESRPSLKIREFHQNMIVIDIFAY
jgi:hypothetical protein